MSTSPFPMTLPPYLRMAVQGRVRTLRSGYYPLQLTFTNALSMRDQIIPAWNALSADVVSPAYYPEFIQIVAFEQAFPIELLRES